MPAPRDQGDTRIARPGASGGRSARGRRRSVRTRRSRVLRWAWRSGLAIALVLTVALGLLVTLGVPKSRIISRLESITGARVQASKVSVSPSLGTVFIHDLTIDVPGLAEPASRVLEVERAEISISRRDLVSGNARPTRVRLFRPLLRISLDDEGVANVVTLASVRQRAQEAPSAAPVPPGAAPVGLAPTLDLSAMPGIEIIDGTVVAGEHDAGDGGSFRALESLRVAGTIRPQRDDQRADIQLNELVSKAGSQAIKPGGLSITGEADLESNRLTAELKGIDLAAVDALNPPRYLRDIWARLDMRGQITSARLLLGPSEGAVAEFTLDGVALTLPITADRATGGPADPLRMSEVSGQISFSRDGVRSDLTGALNDLRARVALSLHGYSASAPFELLIQTTEPFRIAERPQLLPYAPDMVKEISARFGGPTGLVSAAVLATRALPIDGRSSPIVPSGYIHIREGTGAFENFPYPLLEVDARIGFDGNTVVLDAVRALGPTGAMVTATGSIGPLGNEAGVDIRINAVDVPLDAVFQRTLADAGLDLMPILFNEVGHERLRSAGFVQSTSERADDLAALDTAVRNLEALRSVPAPGNGSLITEGEALVERLRQEAAVPAFDLGGEAGLDIAIRRPVGAGKRYTTDIVVRIPKAGLLPAEFPYPIIGTRLGIHISEGLARVEPTAFRTTTGGSGTIRGTVSFDLPGDGGGDGGVEGGRGRATATVMPDITIEAQRVPIEPVLLFALPRGGGAPAWRGAPGDGDAATGETGIGEAGIASFPDALGRLGLSGMASCTARITGVDGASGGGARLAVHAAIDVNDLSADPIGGGALLEGVDARIKIDDRAFAITGFEGRSGDAMVRASARGTLGDPDDPEGASIALDLRTERLDLERPIEGLVLAFVPDMDELFGELRSRHAPRGTVDLDALVRLDGGALDYLLTLDGFAEAGLELFGRRVSLVDPEGSVAVTPTRALFDGFGATIRDESDERGDAGAMRVSLDGLVSLGEGGDSDLRLLIGDGRFESALLRAWMGASAPEQARALEAFGLAGAFDADLTIAGTAPEPATLVGEIAPRSLALDWQGHRFVFEEASGTVGIAPSGGAIGALRGRGEDVSFLARGVWSAPEAAGADGDGGGEGEIGFVVELDASGRGLPEGAMAVLPPDARAALEELEFSIDPGDGGGFVIEGARVEKSARRDGRVLFDGVVSLSNAAFTPGVLITGLDATIDVHSEKPEGEPDASTTIDASATRLRLFGLNFERARSRVLIGPIAGPGGGVSIPMIELNGFSGLVSGRAEFPEVETSLSPGGDPVAAPAFTLDLRMAGLDLGEVLDDAALVASREDGGSPIGSGDPLMAGRRGTIDASVFLTGELERAETHRGRGEIVIEGGDILNIPGVVSLVKLANLMPGADEPFSIARASFAMRHDRITFDSIKLEAPRSGTKLVGVGWMAIPGTELELVFTPQAGRKIPLLSELFGGLRDEVALPVVTGTLREPQVDLRQLSRLRGMLGTIFATRQPASPAGPAEPVARPETPDE
ncbi:MAG: hypothetical protein ACTS3F_02880 [Phycisphaerales bacterium]